MKKIQVLVRLKSGVLDVQGKAVENSIKSLDLGDIKDVRVGKLIEFKVDKDYSNDQISKLCDQILTNPIIEDFEIIEVN